MTPENGLNYIFAYIDKNHVKLLVAVRWLLVSNSKETEVVQWRLGDI